MADFTVARAVLALMEWLGLAAFLIGLGGAAWLMFASGVGAQALSWGAIGLAGFLVVAAAQLSRAMIVTAENSEAILAELQELVRERIERQ